MQASSALDAPAIETILVERIEAAGPFGAKGVGEGAIIAAIPAVANAVQNACGINANSLPMTPEKILMALEQVARDSGASRLWRSNRTAASGRP